MFVLFIITVILLLLLLLPNSTFTDSRN